MVKNIDLCQKQVGTLAKTCLSELNTLVSSTVHAMRLPCSQHCEWSFAYG